MKKIFLHLLAFACSTAVFCAETDPFPAFNALDRATLFPKGAKVSVSKEGHFLVNGKPRYFIGSLYYEGASGTIGIHTTGYPASLNWLYEHVLDYEGHQRMGLDATGINARNHWIRKYRPHWNNGFGSENDEEAKRAILSGLPLYVDFTCASWNHGGIFYKEGMKPSKAAFTVPGKGKSHWMPYSGVTEEGRALYADMWRSGAKSILDLGGKPLIYELFNEANYNDYSKESRALFVQKLKKKFSSIGKLNALWHSSYKNFEEIGLFKSHFERVPLAVEWSIHMEDCFNDLCELGIRTIREVDKRPEALICVQPQSDKFLHVDLYRMHKLMSAVATHTGGGNNVMAREYLSLAEGKPVFDGETYVGNTAASIRSRLISHYARGLNGAFIFKWNRRANDHQWAKKDDAGGRKVAESFPWLMLNPYAVRTEELSGIRRAKEDILLVNDYFTPRDRGVASEVALFYSRPTRRLSESNGSTLYNLYYEYAESLADAPVQYDVLFGEQIIAKRDRKYRLILAPGVATAEPEALAELEVFVRNGGTLLLAGDALQSDIYGFARKDNRFPGLVPGKQDTGKLLRERPVSANGWKEIAPAVLEKSFGKGRVLYVYTSMPREELSTFLRKTIEGANAHLTAVVLDEATGRNADSITVFPAKRNGKYAYLVTNGKSVSQLVLFKGMEKGSIVLPWEKVRLESDAKGFYPVLLKPGDTAALLPDAEGFASWKKLSAAEALTLGKKAVAAETLARSSGAKAFNPDPARLRTVDLRTWANRSFVDRVAGDGKGGWTDQGENSLYNAPWEKTVCQGIAFDFIRPDMNHDRTCIVLGSKHLTSAPKEVKDIRVNSPAAKIYFLHALAWGGEKKAAFRYVVRYEDGSMADIPVRDRIEAGDWHHLKQHLNQPAVPGWKNSQNKGLWIFCWTNPFPEKNIASIDCVSEWRDPIPLIAGITLELPPPERTEIPLFTFSPVNFQTASWSGVHVSILPGSVIALELDRNSKNWCGANLRLPATVRLPDDFKNGFLEFEVNGGPDIWGKTCGGQTIQFRLEPEDPKHGFKEPVSLSKYLRRVDNDPSSWQVVRIPVARLLNTKFMEFNQLKLQFQSLPENRSGLRFRDFRITGGKASGKTAEKEVRSSVRIFDLRKRNFYFAQWGGAKGSLNDRGEIFISISPEAKNFCGINLQLPKSVPVPALANARLEFDLAGGPDFQTCLETKDKKIRKMKNFVIPRPKSQDDDLYIPVSIPLEMILPDGAETLYQLKIQFRYLPKERPGLKIRNIRFTGVKNK